MFLLYRSLAIQTARFRLLASFSCSLIAILFKTSQINSHIAFMASSAPSLLRSTHRAATVALRSSQKVPVLPSRSITTRTSSSRTPQRQLQPLSSHCLRLKRCFTFSANRNQASDDGGRSRHRTGVRIAFRGTSTSSLTR